MNMIKKTDGFTLVELIVVIAILAILAAIAVPAYSGYIAKANEAADYTQLDAIKTAASFAYIDAQVKSGAAATPDIETVAVTVSPFKVEVNGTNVTTDIAPYYDATGLTMKSGATAASWAAATSKWTLTKPTT